MKSVLRDENWSRKIDRVNFQYNSIHLLLWYFLFLPAKQVAGGAERGELCSVIDGLGSAIKSIFAGLRNSLWCGRRESSVCVKKRLTAPAFTLPVFDCAVGGEGDTELRSSTTLPRTGEVGGWGWGGL